MSEQMTVQVSDYAIQHARQIAVSSRQSVESVLSKMIDAFVAEKPVEFLSDDEVLALSEMRMSDEQDEELSDLLARQREAQLDAEGRRRLSELMQVYEQGLLRKSEALRVAVERGLREPLRF